MATTSKNSPSKNSHKDSVKKPTGAPVTATSTKPKANSSDSNASFTEAIGGFARGVKQEWGKISWPTWPQIWAQTIVVLVMASVVSLGLWAVDNLIHLVIQLITPHAIK